MTVKDAPPISRATLGVPLTLTSGIERMFPTLTPAQVERIAAHGQCASDSTWRGARRGRRDQIVPFFVITSGRSRDCPAIQRQRDARRASMDRVSSPARSTCSQAAPRSSERAPASRAK